MPPPTEDDEDEDYPDDLTERTRGEEDPLDWEHSPQELFEVNDFDTREDRDGK